LPVETGQSLLHYRLVDKIGEGGMGVVWKAVDTTLDREVAIKILPEAFATDAERMARFEREAKLLASLNHPNISAIYGLHDSQGIRFIAMELVPGEDLSHHLARGPLSLDEALPLALQIAEALETAHENGVVHRDLKPANIKVDEDGQAKVLDFGLATVDPAPAIDASVSPTITTGGTAAGVILGTAAYMSPEQARGKPVDKRADIWAFGFILFECLTGRRPLAGESVGDTIARILEYEPDWDALPTGTPASVRRLLLRCLRKDPRERLRDIGDARIVLSELLAGGAEASDSQNGFEERRSPARRRRAIAWGLGLAALGAVLGGAFVRYVWYPKEPSEARPTVRASIPLPPGNRLVISDYLSITIAPDGSRLAYVLESPDGTERLYVSEIAQDEARPIPDTEGWPYSPFFSPDGEWVAYFDSISQRLMKVPVDGGAPVAVCEAPPSSRGGSWGPDDEIVFTPGYSSGLYRVSASGGVPTPISNLRDGEKSHRNPQILPDGKTVLFGIATPDITTFDDALIAALDLDSGEIRILIEGGTFARYLPPGHLVYARNGALHAIRFDLERGETLGSPVRVLDGLITSPSQSWALYAISREGTLVYAPGSPGLEDKRVISLDREGNPTPMDVPAENYYRVRVSPDARRLAFSIEAANTDIWIHDPGRKTLTRLTSGWDNEQPVWTPDGSRVVFTSNRTGDGDLYWRNADGSGDAEMLYASGHEKSPDSISPDGEFLVFTENDPETIVDIWVLPLKRPEEAPLLIETDFVEGQPAFSPDGKWIAYMSDQSGQNEAYVTSFPDPSARWQISNAGGIHPMWSKNGRELFYIEGDRMMAVTIDTASGFSAGVPRALFEKRGLSAYNATSRLDLTPDGKGFLAFEQTETAPVESLRLVLNWSAELEAEFPTD
jgi:serine/threonine-protein kinase